MHPNAAQFRFYAELNDFLRGEKKGREFPYRFSGSPSVREAIEALGVPHTEVELIVVNGASVDFRHRIKPGDRIAVYPVFESLDVSPVIRLRRKPLRKVAFVLDCHLGKLARLLRMLGFDTVYEKDSDDHEITRIGVEEKRIILTRDRGILRQSAVTHGYCVRSAAPREQVREVLARFDLGSQVRPFRRCMICNGRIRRVDTKKVAAGLPRHLTYLRRRAGEAFKGVGA